jgi:hypothetical protein
MVAALYLVATILRARPKVDVRLFEGFVSFRQVARRRNHCEDVVLLQEVVKNPDRHSESIIAGNALKIDPTDTLNSAFLVAGIDLGVPPVIIGSG